MALGVHLAKMARGVGVRSDSTFYRTLARNYWGLRSIRGSRHYSQFGEDIALLTLFQGHSRGLYVDIGAGHPTQGSNTYALYRQGWRGTLIEPLKHNEKLTRLLRPGDSTLYGLCGSESGSALLYEYEPWQLSTTSVSAVERLAVSGYSPIAQHQLSVYALRDMHIAARPSEPSLLSIDVEGAEMSVLKGNDWETFTPAVICIEQWDSPLAGTNGVRQLIESRGYELFNLVGNSGIYVHQLWGR